MRTIQLPDLWGITQLTFDTEVEPFYTQLDDSLRALGQELGVLVHSCVAHTLYDIKRIIQANGGEPPLTYKKFLHVLSILGEPDKPAREITLQDFQKCKTPMEDGNEEQYWIPSLEDFAYRESGLGCQLLQTPHLPNSLLPSTTGLSPYFSLGCLSVRSFYYRLSNIYAQVSEEFLLDADYGVNAGNWMWLSASAFFHQYTRIFCPVRFGRRTDPDGQYLRKYLPVLKNFPSKYIYEPWTAPLEVQLEAGCIIGKDYPLPMVNHLEVSQRNMALMRQLRSEQEGTAQLTQGVTDDPMEIGKKRERQDHGPSEDFSLERADKRSSPDGDCKALSCSWTSDPIHLPELSGEVTSPGMVM
ncbi:hypothetical protein SKAU_G00172010 [Synaphobranchus kaupii]|uniref:Photolyase/cryptochrome alpha/beta domain-containing protein n=1 Tax=Synaphobranchus kaupii TaxID=118154 RepID=A0A9Q1IZW7_SYNKA|nr:hypothetical protein SKAU_G00172010 [Synaphobranchus kaupii]